MSTSENNTKAPTISAPGGRGMQQFKTAKPNHTRQTLFRLFSYLAQHRLMLVLIVFLLLISTLASLMGNYLLRPTINEYIIPGKLGELWKIALLMLAVYLIAAISGILQTRLTIYVAQKTVSSIREALFDKMQYLPLRFYDTHQHGDLMSRFTNDIDTISEAMNNSISQLLVSTVTLAGTLTLMIYINPLLTIVSLVMIPAMLYAARKIIQGSKRYFGANQAALGKTNGYVEEMISGQKVVKLFGHEQAVIENFNELNQDLREKALKAQFYSGLMMPLMVNMSTINYALTTIIGGILAITRGLDIGGLATFLQYARQFGRPINEISSQYNSLQAALAGAERIFEIIDSTPETNAKNPKHLVKQVKGEVIFEHVWFAYTPAKMILNDISLTALPGKKIAFVGETGAGKSTIMNLLPGFYPLHSGIITIDGISIDQIPKDELRKNIAIVFQDTHLFTGTVMENIRYGRTDASDEDVIAAAKLAAADSFITRLPEGYQTILTNDGANLSQGQRQLLNIARAAVANAPILVLDEATSSIDTRTEIAIQEGIDNLMKNKTSFVIAHRLSTIQNADEICVIDKGSIVERGTHENLLKQKGLYYSLYKSQFD